MLVRVGCSFLACRGRLAICQTSNHLVIVLSWISRTCHLHFPSCPILLPSNLEKISVVSWLSTRTSHPDRL